MNRRDVHAMSILLIAALVTGSTEIRTTASPRALSSAPIFSTQALFLPQTNFYWGSLPGVHLSSLPWRDFLFLGGRSSLGIELITWGATAIWVHTLLTSPDASPFMMLFGLLATSGARLLSERQTPTIPVVLPTSLTLASRPVVKDGRVTIRARASGNGINPDDFVVAVHTHAPGKRYATERWQADVQYKMTPLAQVERRHEYLYKLEVELPPGVYEFALVAQPKTSDDQRTVWGNDQGAQKGNWLVHVLKADPPTIQPSASYKNRWGFLPDNFDWTESFGIKSRLESGPSEAQGASLLPPPQEPLRVRGAPRPLLILPDTLNYFFDNFRRTHPSSQDPRLLSAG
jgi:hypothetical protein